jgi:hypothetical protein
MHSTAMGPPPARMETQTFGAYAPGTSLRRVRRQLLRTLRAILSMHGRWELLHTVVYSVCWTGTTGRVAPSLGRSWWAAAPGLTTLVPPRRTTLQVHSPRMTRSRQHLLRLVLTVLQMHSGTRRTTYADGLGLRGGGGRREREVQDVRPGATGLGALRSLRD